MCLNPVVGVLIRHTEERHTDRKGRKRVKRKAEIEVTTSQECQGLLAAT